MCPYSDLQSEQKNMLRAKIIAQMKAEQRLGTKLKYFHFLCYIETGYLSHINIFSFYTVKDLLGLNNRLKTLSLNLAVAYVCCYDFVLVQKSFHKSFSSPNTNKSGWLNMGSRAQKISSLDHSRKRANLDMPFHILDKCWCAASTCQVTFENDL